MIYSGSYSGCGKKFRTRLRIHNTAYLIGIVCINMAAPVGTAAVPALPEPASERCNFPAGRGTQLHENHSGIPSPSPATKLFSFNSNWTLKSCNILPYTYSISICSEFSFQLVSHVKFTDSLLMRGKQIIKTVLFASKQINSCLYSL